MRRKLEVHAANRALAAGQGLVDLRDRLAPAGRLQFLRAKHAGEKTAFVGLLRAFDYLQARERRVDNLKPAHASAPGAASASKSAMSCAQRSRALLPSCWRRYQFIVRRTAIGSDQRGATPSTCSAFAVSSASQPASCGPPSPSPKLTSPLP